MPIRAFLHGRSFDPERIEVMNAVFLSVCNDLGLSVNTGRTCEIVAKRVIELMDDRRDPEDLRKAVLASIKADAA